MAMATSSTRPMARAETGGWRRWILAAAEPVWRRRVVQEGRRKGGRRAEGSSPADGAPRRADGRRTGGHASVSLTRRVATKTEKEIDLCVLLGQGYFGPFKWRGEVKTLQKKKKERKWLKSI